jgi:phosphatidylserine/phosphatidylglycerophosphate/cardiolipin synthase-like enzyme
MRGPRFGLDLLDARVGDGVESMLRAHHQRRLRRLGWAEVFADRAVDDWFAARRPVREGNAVEVLVDGEEALSAMSAAIAGARSHVHIANWHATPDFRLIREPSAPTLGELLAETAERVPVRMLLWAGPPAPIFKPTRRTVIAAADGFTRGTKVRCVLDRRERTLHCHHEKVVVVDDTTAFVGGIDFTALQGDRHDSSAHPPHTLLGWHDAAVRLAGPIVADVAGHFAQRWSEVAGEGLPAPQPSPPSGVTAVQLVRTMPERTYRFAPRGEFTILDTYLRALRSAQRLVYLENQFLWSPEIADVLIDKLRRPPHDRFRVVLVLPRRPTSGADTTRGQLGRLIDADGDGRRLLPATLTAHDGERSAPLYVHAKVGIVDDAWMTIGSANLNEHSLFNDSEVNVVTCDEPLARQTRLRLWSEHLQRPVPEISGDPADVVDEMWRPVAEEQARLARAGTPPTHRLTLLPGVSRRAARLFGPIRGLLVDG